MKFRTLGRTGWKISEIGYGTWGAGGWTGSDRDESLRSFSLAVENGCNFFDTAYAYGDGYSERLLGELLKQHPDKKLYVASKIPPKNLQWPSRRGAQLADVFPPDYIRQLTEKSLENLGLDCLDLQQFHVWEDSWARDDSWHRAVEDLKRSGLVRAVGISVNRWEPENALETLRTGLIDAVQVIYNIFDQAPEDELFPLCGELNIGVIARVPFDEGTLTDTLTKDSHWPADDWRSTYFVPENLAASVKRADRLKPLVADGMTMPAMALRWILAIEHVSTVIPGMRRQANVRANIAVSDGQRLSPQLMQQLRSHRWNRVPTEWSQ